MAEDVSVSMNGKFDHDKYIPQQAILSEQEEKMETQHFKRIVNAFKHYKEHSALRLMRTENYVTNLPKKHQELLRFYSCHLKKLHEAVDSNYHIIEMILRNVESIFENQNISADDDKEQPRLASSMDMEKVQSTLKLIVRDWSVEGKDERRSCYQPIIDEIELRFPRCNFKPDEVAVLVPGAGLGRLAYEIAKRGYMCQGNEFSLFMLFTSNFILNRCPESDVYKLYPWIHQFCNNVRSEDQLKVVTFPDVNPHLPPESHFSMAAGDFLDIYRESAMWNCVATCFFLDTANNVIAYIETIWKILKPGGYWINLGPLLYHYADLPHENSIEPSYEDIHYIIKQIGFHFIREDKDVKTSYSQNSHSMLRYEYSSVFFVCQKPFGLEKES